VGVGEAGMGAVLGLGEDVRAAGIACEIELSSRSLGATLKRADKSGVRIVLILGDEELASDAVTVKDLERGTQERVPRHTLIETLETTR
jgi:histidyl-tRNA synthetase